MPRTPRWPDICRDHTVARRSRILPRGRFHQRRPFRRSQTEIAANETQRAVYACVNFIPINPRTLARRLGSRELQKLQAAAADAARAAVSLRRRDLHRLRAPWAWSAGANRLPFSQTNVISLRGYRCIRNRNTRGGHRVRSTRSSAPGVPAKLRCGYAVPDPPRLSSIWGDLDG